MMETVRREGPKGRRRWMCREWEKYGKEKN